MENAVQLEVPNKVDYESGENWGDIYDWLCS
jgi:DNA polymerase I-like protein with 3'-5' exonuclease and polymerase domains